MLLLTSYTDAPASPGCPDVEEVGGDFVSLTWEKPKSDGGGKIKGYYIEKKDANSDNWLRVNRKPTQATIFNVPNLIEDREYEFRIIAINEAGESKPSIGTRKVKVKDPKGLHFNSFGVSEKQKMILATLRIILNIHYYCYYY